MTKTKSCQHTNRYMKVGVSTLLYLWNSMENATVLAKKVEDRKNLLVSVSRIRVVPDKIYTLISYMDDQHSNGKCVTRKILIPHITENMTLR